VSSDGVPRSAALTSLVNLGARERVGALIARERDSGCRSSQMHEREAQQDEQRLRPIPERQVVEGDDEDQRPACG
jgi:hypothetical protein